MLLSIVPIGWFFVNGITGSAPIILILFTAILSSLYKSKYWKWLIISLFVELSILIFIQLIFPEFIKTYPDQETEIIDTIFTIFIAMFFVGFLVYKFKLSYDDDRFRLLELNCVLQLSEDELKTQRDELKIQKEEFKLVLEQLNENNETIAQEQKKLEAGKVDLRITSVNLCDKIQQSVQLFRKKRKIKG